MVVTLPVKARPDGVHRHPDALPRTQRAQRLLRQGQVGVHGGRVGQRHQRIAGPGELAQVDAAHAQHAVERRLDALLLDLRLHAPEIALGLVIVGLGLVQLLAGRRLLGQQPAAAVQLRTGVLHLRLQPGQLALLGRIVQLHQQLAGARGFARIEQDLRHPAVHFGRHLHLARRLQRADAAERHREIGLHGRRHHLGGRHGPAALVSASAVLPVQPVPIAAASTHTPAAHAPAFTVMMLAIYQRVCFDNLRKPGTSQNSLSNVEVSKSYSPFLRPGFSSRGRCSSRT